MFFYYCYYQYYLCRSAHHPFSSTQLGFRYFPRWLRRPPNFRRVLEYWSRRVTYLPCMRWWYPSCRSSRVRKYVSWRTHVCAHQNLAARSTCTNATTLPRLLLPRLRFQRLSWPAVTRFPTRQRSRWPCPIKSNPPRRPESWASDRLQGRQRCHVGIPQSVWG